MLDLANFVLEPAEIEQIYKFIHNRSRPSSIRELGELIIRRRLEVHSEAKKRRIYSPEQKYAAGEKIFFYFHDNKYRLAEILRIEPGSHSEYGSYERIAVSVEGFEKEKAYVSNCPHFPLRFGFNADYVDTANPGNAVATPGQLFIRHEASIRPNMTQALLKQDGLLNVDDEWFVIDEIPKITHPEIQRCWECIEENGKPIPSSKLVCDVLKCLPSSPKFGIFRFSLDHHLNGDRKFIKYQSAEGAKWGIKRAIPPRQIRNTLTLTAISSGFIKITKGLQELVEFFKAADEITFKSYGEYEVRGCIDPVLKRIYGEQIRQWFAENRLAPGDVIYIKSPASADEHPVLYTTFEGDSHEKSGKKEEKDAVCRKANLRHRIYMLLDSRGQYLHVKEIHRHIRESSSEDVTQPTTDAILSGNKHLFARLHDSRGLWGLSTWESERPGVDSISLSIAIREEDWVRRLLEAELKPLTVIELADRLAGIFITPKEKILETNFFDPNDERFIQIDGKWGLKVWARDWKARIEEINTELSEYEKLSAMLSGAKDKKLRLEAAISDLEERKTLIQNQLTRLEKASNFTRQKIPKLQKQHDDLIEQTQSVQKKIPASRRSGNQLTITLVFILAAVSLFLTIDNTYQSLGLILGFLTAILFLFVLIREINAGLFNKRLTKKREDIQAAISKINGSLADVEQKHHKIANHRSRYLRALALMEERIGTTSSQASLIRKRIEDISYRVRSFELLALDAEKEALTELIDRCALQ